MNRGNCVLNFKQLVEDLIKISGTVNSTTIDHINDGQMALKKGILVQLKNDDERQYLRIAALLEPFNVDRAKQKLKTFGNDEDRNDYCKKYIFIIENFGDNSALHAMVADEYNPSIDKWTLYNSWGEDDKSPEFSSDSE